MPSMEVDEKERMTIFLDKWLQSGNRLVNQFESFIYTKSLTASESEEAA